jgi:hypothetical protein
MVAIPGCRWCGSRSVDLHLKLTRDLHLILTRPDRPIIAENATGGIIAFTTKSRVTASSPKLRAC